MRILAGWDKYKIRKMTTENSVVIFYESQKIKE